MDIDWASYRGVMEKRFPIHWGADDHGSEAERCSETFWAAIMSMSGYWSVGCGWTLVDDGLACPLPSLTVKPLVFLWLETLLIMEMGRFELLYSLYIELEQREIEIEG